MTRWIISALILFSSAVQANRDALWIDTSVPVDIELAFPNRTDIQPDVSEFSVLNFVPMSNELGERWVVLTIHNQASGSRTLEHKHIMALLADGTRVLPEKMSQRFLANEVLSLVVNFGESKFPLLDVYSRTQT